MVTKFLKLKVLKEKRIVVFAGKDYKIEILNFRHSSIPGKLLALLVHAVMLSPFILDVHYLGFLP